MVVTAQTPENVGFTINFAYLKSPLEFQLDTGALSIYNPHVSLHAVRTAAAFQEASDVHSLHATFYHKTVKKKGNCANLKYIIKRLKSKILQYLRQLQ